MFASERRTSLARALSARSQGPPRERVTVGVGVDVGSVPFREQRKTLASRQGIEQSSGNMSEDNRRGSP